MCEQLPAAGDEDQPLCEAFADVLVGQIHQNLMEEKTTRWELTSTICNDELAVILFKLNCTFPRRPLCLESRLPPFFTATSRVLLWSSMRETVNSNLGQRRRRAFTHQQTPGKHESVQQCSRLVVNRVQVSLECVGFPPAWPPFVREEVEADVRVWAVVGEGDQVPAEAETLEHQCSRTNRYQLLNNHQRWNTPAGVNNHNKLVPLGTVPDRQLDLTQREVSRPRPTTGTQRTQSTSEAEPERTVSSSVLSGVYFCSCWSLCCSSCAA